jgi:hypothetical protein
VSMAKRPPKTAYQPRGNDGKRKEPDRSARLGGFAHRSRPFQVIGEHVRNSSGTGQPSG